MKIIPLNLRLSHPVHWNKYKIFQNFIRNFYDSVGYETWHKQFHYEIRANRLYLIADKNIFNYENPLWIAPFSVANSETSGHFQELFKIASLCAYRDYNWQIRISSPNSTITIVEQQTIVNMQEVCSLAYEFEEHKTNSPSTLELYPISETDLNIFKEALYSFYYPENPLLGELIWQSEESAVYYRSNLPIPDHYPPIYNLKKEGIVFCKRQARGSFPIPLVICKHNYQSFDLEKESFYQCDIVKIVYQIAEMISAEGAEQLLPIFARYWNSYPLKHVDLNTWYYVICELIRKIASSHPAISRFQSQYPNLLYTQRLCNNEPLKESRHLQTKIWLRNQPTKYQLVQEQFKLLGYENLETFCRHKGVFVPNDLPT